MKKFIAGVVLTVVAFMALTTGVLAKGNYAYPNGGSKSCYSNGNGAYNSQYDYSIGC